MKEFVTILPATDVNLHFIGDGKGSFTSLSGALTGLAITASSGTSLSTTSGTLPAVGTVLYAFTSDGFFSTVTVTTNLGAASGGTVTCPRQWSNVDRLKTGRAPAAAQTVTLHTQSGAGECRSVVIESILLRGNITGVTVLTLTNAIGTVQRTLSIPAAAVPAGLDAICGEYFGPFGFQVGTTAQLGLDIFYRTAMPAQIPVSSM